MTRGQTRDKIRIEAGIPGDNAFDYLINAYLDEELKMLTALRRYPECSLLGVSLTWERDNPPTTYFPYAILPSDLQHLDVNNIRYYNGNLYGLLRPWIRDFVNQTTGIAFQFRRTTYLNTVTAAYDQVLQISPPGNIVFPTQNIFIDYWRQLSWSNDTSNFPIPRLETTVALKVVERIANLQNSGLAAKAAGLAKEQYIAARAQNTGDS